MYGTYVLCFFLPGLAPPPPGALRLGAAFAGAAVPGVSVPWTDAATDGAGVLSCCSVLGDATTSFTETPPAARGDDFLGVCDPALNLGDLVVVLVVPFVVLNCASFVFSTLRTTRSFLGTWLAAALPFPVVAFEFVAAFGGMVDWLSEATNVSWCC